MLYISQSDYGTRMKNDYLSVSRHSWMSVKNDQISLTLQKGLNFPQIFMKGWISQEFPWHDGHRWLDLGPQITTTNKSNVIKN